MGEKPEGVSKSSLPDLDDLLQCPVCYEVPTGHIYQCNEGHHVCGECKSRLHNCPVCRSLFFGTRNYAMEGLLANIRRLQAFKIAGKTTMTVPLSNDGPSNQQADSGFASRDTEESTSESRLQSISVAASPGTWRCFMHGCAERLPSCRLINHLRYFHRSHLMEAHLTDGEYSQVWDISPQMRRLTSAIHIFGVGVFWMNFAMPGSLKAWLTMASINYNSLGFNYTLSASCGHREYLFKDHVRSSRDSEGSLSKRRRMLEVPREDVARKTGFIRVSLHLSLHQWRERSESEIVTSWFDEPEHVVRIANLPESEPESESDIQDIEDNMLLLNDYIQLYLLRAGDNVGLDALVAAALPPNGHERRQRPRGHHPRRRYR